MALASALLVERGEFNMVDIPHHTDMNGITFDFHRVKEEHPASHDTPVIDAMGDHAAAVGQNEETASEVINRALVEIGGRVPSRKRDALSVAELRRRGLAVVSVAAIAMTPVLGNAVVESVKYNLSSDIPGSTENLDPAHYRTMVIPESGAQILAREVDFDHNPNRGVERFEDQLGHKPHAGDRVAVPQ